MLDYQQVYMSVFAQLGVPLVNQAPGIELQDDGIHWKVSSHEAVLALVDVLIRESAHTANFRVCPPAPVWQWRFNPAHNRHYPECKKYGKIANDDHLISRPHHEKCGGNLTGFMFADRSSLCYNGLQFKLDNGTIDTRPFIPADRPLQVLCGEVPVETPPNNPIEFFEVVEHLSKKHVSTTLLPEMMRVKIHWTEGTAEEVVSKFLHLVTLATLSKPMRSLGFLNAKFLHPVV